MSIKATLAGVAKFRKIMKAESSAWERATLGGVKAQTRETQLGVRGQVNKAFHGSRRIGNTVRSKVWERKTRRQGAAGLIWSKFGRKKGGRFVDYIAPRLFGATVKPTGGRQFLMIPKQKGRNKRTVAQKLADKGKLTFIPIKGGRKAVLVKNTKSRSTIIALLVRKVVYPRRTTPAQLMAGAVRGLPGEITRAYRRGIVGR